MAQPLGMGRYIAHTTGMYGYGWLFEIVILLVLILIIYLLVSRTQKHESALDILNRRLALGEISQKEYHSLRKEIGGK